MTEENVYLVAEKYKEDIPKENYQEFVGYLRDSSDESVDGLMNMPLKDCKKSLLLTIFLGLFGADRFYLEDKKGGVFKIVMLVVAALFAIAGGILLGITLADKAALAKFTADIAVLTEQKNAAIDANIAIELADKIAVLESQIAGIESSLSITDTSSMILLLIGGIILVISIARWIMDITSASSVAKTVNYRTLTSYIWKHELKEEGVPERFPSQL